MSKIRKDARYGCSLCINAPQGGGMDRLKKGHKSVERRSLQYHVETYHPEIKDWMSLTVHLEPAEYRSSRRKRLKRDRAPSIEDANTATEGKGGESQADGSTQQNVLASLPTLTRGKYVERTAVNAYDDVSSEADSPVSAERLPRDELSRLEKGRQELVTALGDLIQENRGLLNITTSIVEMLFAGTDFTIEGVTEALLHLSRGDRQVMAQVLAQVVSELSRRHQHHYME